MVCNYECCELFLIAISVVITIITITSSRDIDENGMDSYDRMWEIAGEGVSRDVFGNIYKDGEYDIWSNIFDHNPCYKIY